MSVELRAVELNVETRDVFGKYATSNLRDIGKLPAVIYGEGKETLHLMLDDLEFTKAIPQIKSEKILILKNKDKSYKAIIKTIQRHHVSDKPLHIDFIFIEEDKDATFYVPLKTINSNLNVALKSGGFMHLVKRKIEILCNYKDLPKSIDVDVKEATIGSSIRISDVVFPKNVQCSLDPFTTIITVVGKKATKTKDSEEGEKDGAK